MSEKPTRAVVPPPTKVKSFLPEDMSGESVQAADNMESTERKQVMLSFSIPADQHAEYKQMAAKLQVKMVDLFRETYLVWQQAPEEKRREARRRIELEKKSRKS